MIMEGGLGGLSTAPGGTRHPALQGHLALNTGGTQHAAPEAGLSTAPCPAHSFYKYIDFMCRVFCLHICLCTSYVCMCVCEHMYVCVTICHLFHVNTRVGIQTHCESESGHCRIMLPIPHSYLTRAEWLPGRSPVPQTIPRVTHVRCGMW